MRKIFITFLLFCVIFSGCSIDVQEPVILKDGDTVGAGAVTFELVIADTPDHEIRVQVSTDEITVGDALQKLHVLSGTQGEYGLYVDTVNGITVDYEKDRKYWAFYVDGVYAEKSISATQIDPESVYMLTIEE